MEHLSGETLEDARKKLTKEKLDNILFNKSKGGSPYVVNPNDFHINEDKLLCVTLFGTSKEIP